MKNSIQLIAIGLTLLFASSACNKIDNYDGPTETLQGQIMDAGTGQGLQSEVSGDNGAGTRIKLLEISWSDNPTPLYLATKQDGTYINTKVFAATYHILAEGAFVPLDLAGNDQTKTVDVKGGATTVDFMVDPFLRVEWVGEPVLNPDGTVSVKVRVTRGTHNPDFQQHIINLALFLCPYEYVGNNNYDSRYSTIISYSGDAGNAIVGQTLTLTSTGKLPQKDWYLRVGSRIAYGTNRYNYSTIKMVAVQ
ncbi:hypothetical protein A8C56_10895 [Niabella ginsenosidivorans]|uniref:DUF3823 domain-containing protein n=1 Tax=Niabella ginsenosidivorans TaxID=1176587 RepID=A0A1A9I409_9BACT|nr:DUF3823 domain-containing protein [Niabella ginsenosidivorans]ANH81422.1 hypothetical protein A8C56_10895 [Niabella ginsenosidivorans]